MSHGSCRQVQEITGQGRAVLEPSVHSWPHTKNGRHYWQPRVLDMTGRGERIWTSDLSVPNRAHYQAVLRPVEKTKRDILAGYFHRGQVGLLKTCGQKWLSSLHRKCPMADAHF